MLQEGSLCCSRFCLSNLERRRNILYKTEQQNNMSFCNDIKCLNVATVLLVSCKPMRVGTLGKHDKI